MSDKEIEKLWREFGDLPLNDSDDITEGWNGWEAGTHKIDVWEWFDRVHSKGIYYLIHESNLCEQ